MKSSTKKKITAFILALVLLASASSVGYFLTTAETSNWTYNRNVGILIERNAEMLSESDTNYAAVSQQAKLFSSELSAKLNRTSDPLEIAFGAAELAGANDMILRFGASQNIPEQGYSVYTENGRLIIAASDMDGLFYGCRYVIKQILSNGNEVENVENEAPSVKERALMLDIGRKYFDTTWIKNMIQEISWSDMNTLILHFSEEMGLGLESKKYSWLNGRDGTLCTVKEVTTNNSYITQENMASIIEYAKTYHVKIVPSFDSPGHMNYIVKKFNAKSAAGEFSFTYDGETITVPQGTDIGNYYHYDTDNDGVEEEAIVPGSGNTAYSRGIDISNDIAVKFTKSLIEEYADFFREQGCTDFDLGGDELLGFGPRLTQAVPRWQQLKHWERYAQNLALIHRWSNVEDVVAYDAFIYYMNDLWDILHVKGYESIRMWNDDALRIHDTEWQGANQLNTGFDMQFWTYDAANQTVFERYANLNYSAYNCLKTYNYYVLKEGEMEKDIYKVSQQSIFENWNPYVFNPNNSALGYGNDNSYIGDDKVKGSSFCVWCDDPYFMGQTAVKATILPLIKANGAKAWDPLLNNEISYNAFVSRLNAIGDYPTNLPDTDSMDIYIIPDIVRLRFAAYDDYDRIAHHENEYTDVSFSEYRDAVMAGRNILSRYESGEKPTIEQVETALEDMRVTMAALEYVQEIDLSAIEAAIAEFSSVDSETYTAESYRIYKNEVNSAKNMLEKGGYKQRDINDNLSTIVCARKNLVGVNDTSNCIETVKLRTHDVNHDEVAILGIKFKSGVDYKNFTYEIYAGVDGEMDREIMDIVVNEKKGVVYLYFVPEAAGINVDTVYVRSGSEIVGSYSFTVNIV